MDPAALDTITDVTTLRALVREQLAVIAEREHTLACKEALIAKLTHELARRKRRSIPVLPGVGGVA